MFCLDVRSRGYRCNVDSGGLMRNKNSDAARRRTKLEVLHLQLQSLRASRPPGARTVSAAFVAKEHKGSEDQLALIRCESLTASRLRQARQKPLYNVLFFFK